MNPNTDIWRLPTALQMLADIRDDLSQGVSLCLIDTQANHDFIFQKYLLHQLENLDGLNVACLDLTELKKINLKTLFSMTGKMDDFSNNGQIIASDIMPDVLLLQRF